MTKKAEKKENHISEKEVEKEVEKLVEKKVKEFFDSKKFEKKVSESKFLKIFGEFIGYAIFLLLVFVVFPKLSFITSDFKYYLPIAVWTTTVSLVLKILEHASDANPIKRIMKIGDLSLSIYSIYWLTVIYPFNFAGIPQLNGIFYIALKISIYAMALAIFVNFIRIFVPERNKK